MNIQNRQFGLDFLFILGVVFSLIFAGKIIPFLFVFGILPIPFLYKNLRDNTIYIPSWRLYVPATVFFAYMLLTLFFFTGLQPGDTKPVNPDLELYGVAIGLLFVGLLRSLEVVNLKNTVDLVLPWSLLGAFVVLTILMFVGYKETCRLQAGAAWPFIPALIFTTLTFLSFAGWQNFSTQQRRLRLLLNAFAIVVVVGYTGSRGILIAQLGVLFLFFLANFRSTFWGAIPSRSQLFVSILLGFGLCGVTSAITGCNSLDRITPVFDTIRILSQRIVDNPADTKADTSPLPSDGTSVATGATTSDQAIMNADVSIGLRLEMWKTSLHAIVEAPFFGHGSLYLQHLITQKYGFEHNHNQYLSWLVTGGIVGLSVGLLFLAIPWLISVGLTAPDRLIITLSVSIFWGIAVLFDSYFNLKFYTHYYCLLCGLLFALVNDMVVSRQRIKDKQ